MLQKFLLKHLHRILNLKIFLNNPVSGFPPAAPLQDFKGGPRGPKMAPSALQRGSGGGPSGSEKSKSKRRTQFPNWLNTVVVHNISEQERHLVKTKLTKNETNEHVATDRSWQTAAADQEADAPPAQLDAVHNRTKECSEWPGLRAKSQALPASNN